MNNDTLVDAITSNDHYLRYKSPRDPRVLAAMRRVDRKEFLPEGQLLGLPLDLLDAEKLARIGIPAGLNLENIQTSVDAAYLDIPVHIGYLQTCSAPSMVALMADILELKPGMQVLEIGTGCGYHAAITAELVSPEGKVTSIEYIPELAQRAQGTLSKYFDEHRVQVIYGDGSCGFPANAPYDRIYFTTGIKDSRTFPLPEFQEQLTESGMLLVAQHEGALLKFNKQNARPEKIGILFGFVPLQGRGA